MKKKRLLVLYADSVANRTASYQHTWPAAFVRQTVFEATILNVSSPRWKDRFSFRKVLNASGYDYLLMLHSIFSNNLTLDRFQRWVLLKSKIPKIYFIGNEYKLMPEKVKFCKEYAIDILVSQSSDPRVHALYRSQIDCHIMHVPNCIVWPELVRNSTLWHERSIDVGYRAYDAPWYLGHCERAELGERAILEASELELIQDISLDPKARFATGAWFDFLGRCKAQIASEAGGDFFELTDSTRNKVNAYLKAVPSATFQEVYDKFFLMYGQNTPLRLLSSRHVEAAASGCVQILVEGEYSGYLKPFQHYLPVSKDLHDLKQALRTLKDGKICEMLIKNSYNVVQRNFTVDAQMERIRGIVS